MKKVTKFLIGAGIGYFISKFIKDHLKIEINIDVKEPNEPVEDEKTKELYDEALEQVISHEDDEENGEESIDICWDRVYYDNKYNICTIFLNRNRCPYAFEFAYADDAQKAYDEFKNLYKGKDKDRIYLFVIFRILGLIIDDYEEFKNHYIFWDEEIFEADNRCIPDGRFLSFGTGNFAK